MLVREVLVVAASAVLICCTDAHQEVSVYTEDAALSAALSDFVALSETGRIRLGDDAQRRIRVGLGLDCTECYSIEVAPDGVATVRGGDLLGAQYGVAAAMEQLGVRFYHPRWTFVPERLGEFSPVATTEPRLARRGLHLHTLHPIESYFAIHEPGQASAAEFEHIADWIVKNRGDFVKWYALRNIQRDAAAHAEWKAHTQRLVEIAHSRGLEVGVTFTVFGRASLQDAFVLIEDEADATAPTLESRLRLLLGDVAFDSVTMSFGEFLAEDPQRFIADLNLVVSSIRAVAGEVEVTASVHVGDSEDQKVVFDGQEMIYYFLVQFADVAIVPWVHTVMYYTLFDDAGGAYHHEDFSAHRDLLLSYLEQGRPVAYYPETAYWVAFDNSVPTYLPVYLWSRWRDLRSLDELADERGVARLDQQILFSSGWEWGYWQNDYLGLRHAFADAELEDSIAEMLAPLRGASELASVVADIAQIQKRHLIDQRLAAYLAGRDALLDAGAKLGFLSQPARTEMGEIVTMSREQQTRFLAEVVEPMFGFADELDEAAVRARTAAGDRWGREIADGTEVTALRARYMAELMSAALAAADGQSPASSLRRADSILESARRVVADRQADMHDRQPERLIGPTSNLTVYQFGYLEKGHTLCYWERERTLLDVALSGQSRAVPDCAL